MSQASQSTLPGARSRTTRTSACAGGGIDNLGILAIDSSTFTGNAAGPTPAAAVYGVMAR